ncbi:hypothetical protein GCM10017044_21810 [Kordiimonas sediminis]|uniref:DUF560 domain-containing protein n=1 Tax=Kordiimonas sediminis TaxID=1735581 RepID=A0A919AUN4_9PROT|nr:porin family protein [Kordiimonas sediminis]GHF26480.1 hypothetical protein GCM10017044_21810 [Kordiimonas sediminis]
MSEQESFDRIPLTQDQVFETVSHLILTKQHQAALTLLSQLEHSGADQIQIDFLRGTIAGQNDDWPMAIRYYRGILAGNPSLLRVRLELARAFFNAADYDNAKRQFELVLASDQLPAEVRTNVRGFLAVIYTRKKWSLNVSFSAAPDTNINTATASERVTLYGLPFDLSDDAKRSSGVGITGDVSAGYRFDLRQGLAVDVGGAARHTEYLNSSSFDQTYLRAHMGPRVYTARSEVRVLAAAGYARFGGRSYYTSAGMQVTAQRQLNDRLKASILVGVDKMNYTTIDYRDGENYSLTGQVNYSLSRVSSFRTYAGINLEKTQEASLDNTTYRIGFGYARELGLGLTATLSGSFTYRPFDAFSILYGEKRTDHTISTGVGFTKRDINIWGFAPVVRYDYFRSMSNITLFDYDRHRINIGFTRVF